MSTSTPSPSSLPFNHDLTLGVLEIGVLTSIFLFGLVTIQTYIYFNKFSNDPRGLKILVALVWILEVAHSISVCHALYTVTVTQYGQPELLGIPPQSLGAALLFSGFIGPLEQGWFAHRIYKFSKSIYLPIICLFLSAARFTGSLGLSIVAFRRPTLQYYEKHWLWLLTSVLVVGAGTDLMLAASLCYYLSKYRQSPFKRTVRLIDRLMVWTIETGLITSVGAVTVLLCFLTMPRNFIWIGMFTILARLFSNTLLASLNARQRFARMYGDIGEIPTELQIPRFSVHGTSTGTPLESAPSTELEHISMKAIVP